MIPLLRFPILVSLLALLLAVDLTEARLFEPLPVPPKLVADENTVGLWEFRRDAFASREMPDVSGKSKAGRITGNWDFVTPAELVPPYPGAGRVLDSKKTADRSEVVFGGLDVLTKGPFSIDVVLRWEVSGGFFLRLGSVPEKNAPVGALGVLHRGPGQLELRLPVKTASGENSKQVFSSLDVFKDPSVGPVKFDQFYTYSLVFDGGKTFRVFIDGRQAYEAVISDGSFFLNAPELAVGHALDWNSVFRGEIAAVRVSKGVRQYQPPSAKAAGFSKASDRGWRIDAGPANSSTAAGQIALGPDSSYSAKQGYGWLQKPTGEFDSWYMPGRYAATPKLALDKNEHKIMDAAERDGLVFGKGDFFKIDVPDGMYWVAVEVGNNTGPANVASLSANGELIGADLLTDSNIHGGAMPERMARGLVHASGGQGITLSAQTAASGIPIKSLGVLPYAPLPMTLKGRHLEWTGEGKAPDGFDAVAAALDKDDTEGATQAADRISDPFLKACALSFILGHPKLPDAGDVKTAQAIRELLLKVLQEQPGNAAARWLFDSTERFRQALIAYLGEHGTEISYGSRFIWPLHAANLGLSLKPQDPGYWQGRFLAGAGIWQAATQSSAFAGFTDSYAPGRAGLKAYAAPGKLFREVIAAWPDFRIARIMLGEKLPIAADWTPPVNSPKWATLQYSLLQRILGVLHYWTNVRMDENGLMGGGLGDDVEALRWWAPGVLLADDQDTIRGWRLLANTAWDSTGGAGYSNGMDDVEHSAEPTSDTLSMLGVINYDTKLMPETLNRLSKTGKIFRDLWTTVTPEGYRMFKGHHLSATKIEREGDVPYNLRAIRPLVWAVWAAPGKYPELESTLVEYAKSWLAATMAETDGKPAGLPPMMIMMDRSKMRAEGAKDWVFPGYWSYEYPTGYVDKVYQLFLAGYAISGDKDFLEPVRFGLAALRNIPEGDEASDKYPRASLDWALRQGIGLIGAAGANYRSITGDRSFDDVLLRFGPAFTHFQIAGGAAKTRTEWDKAIIPLQDKLSGDLAEMNTNPELRTSMVQSTDRIYVRGSQVLTSMATGMPTADSDLRGGEILWPNFAITWNGTQGQTSVLVTDSSPTKVDVLLYSFADQPLKLSPHIWQLQPGAYRLTLNHAEEDGLTAGKEIARQEIQISSRGQQISFDLPAKTPVKFSLTKK